MSTDIPDTDTAVTNTTDTDATVTADITGTDTNASDTDATVTATTPPPHEDILRDIFLWRKKKLSISIFIASTAIWVMLEVYGFTFVTIASWIAIFVVGVSFIWSNILALSGKEMPDITRRFELSEQTTMAMATTLHTRLEKSWQWIFMFAVESDLMVFIPVITSLWVLSLVGSKLDFVTLLYVDVLMGLVFPIIYVKYEDKIKSFIQHVRIETRRWQEMVDAKVLSKLRKGVSKLKKVE